MVRLQYFADPKNLEVVEDEPAPKPKVEEGPEGETSLELMQAVYRDRKQPLAMRVRCAVEAAPYENPRVSAIAVTDMNGKDFASALERCIQRSQSPLTINAPTIEHDAQELRGPMPRLERRFG